MYNSTLSALNFNNSLTCSPVIVHASLVHYADGCITTDLDNWEGPELNSLLSDEPRQCNATCLFLQGAKCQEVLVESLASLVAAPWKAEGDDDISVADKTTEILTELSMDEVSKEVAVVLPWLLKAHGDEVKCV